MSGHCHKLVAKIAREACAELYERLMGENVVRTEWKRQNPDCTEHQLLARFVNRNWSKCIPFARATLARLLTTSIDDKTKDEIMEALMLDQTLTRGRADNAARVVGQISQRS